jgi:hypothetical protein
MNSIFYSSPCAVIWLISGHISCILCECHTVSWHTEAIQALESLWRFNLALCCCFRAICPPLLLSLVKHKSVAFACHAFVHSSTAHVIIQPLTALPLNIILSLSGARTCPDKDSVYIAGSDALQEVGLACAAFSRLQSYALKCQYHLTLCQFTGSGAALNTSGLACICVGIIAYFWHLNRQAAPAAGALALTVPQSGDGGQGLMGASL